MNMRKVLLALVVLSVCGVNVLATENEEVEGDPPVGSQVVIQGAETTVNITVYEDSGFDAMRFSLDNLGLSYSYHDGDDSGFVADLASGTFGLAVINQSNSSRLNDDLDSIHDFVLGGGKLIIANNQFNVAPSHPLWQTMGAAWQANLDSPVNPLVRRVPTHPIFNLPHTVPDLVPTHNAIDNGDYMSALAAATTVAGSPGADPLQSLIIVRDDDQTILNSFTPWDYQLSDFDNDQILDVIELFENQITFILTNEQGLISHWKFDEGEGTTAYDSAGDNDGTIYGAQWAVGQIDGALEFDGVDDYVEITGYKGISGTSARTCAAWIKTNENGQIISWGENTVGRKWTFRVDFNGSVRAEVSGGGINSSTAVDDGAWHHVAVVWENDGSPYICDAMLYVDGQQETTSCSGDMEMNTASYANVRIGKAFIANRNFHGLIDDVRVYDRALSAEEIEQLYLTGLPDVVTIDIVGPNEVAENFSASYKAIAHYDNNSTKDVTDSALWSVEPNTAASIDDYGVLTTKDIVEGQLATIRASYTEGVVTIEAQKAIHILALVGIEITGPSEVTENFSASYKAIAYYDNNSTRDVTNSALWAVEPNTAANIDENGVLTTKDIVREQAATILASYTEGDVTFDAEKAIHIFAICPTGTALQFDGVDDYVDCGNDSNLNVGDGSYTLAAWIKTALSPLSPRGVILAKMKDGGSYQGYDIKINPDGTIWPHLISSWSSNAIRVHGSTAINDGSWHHVTVTYDGSNSASGFSIYIDGKPETLTTTHDSLSGSTVNDANFTIGSRYGGEYLNGKIDEVAIYNRALSIEEIQANMHTRLLGSEPGLVGYWDFDEGEGQIVYDLSGNGNNGQLGSTPDPDESDPAWVDSDAPIGICSLYQIATMAADRAVECKTALLEELLAALAKEWTAYETLEELFESGDYGDLNKGDIVTAKQKIHSAIQHEEQSIDALEKSIEKLKDALSALGYEPEPPPM